MPDAFENIEFNIESGIACLVLNRPDKLNSFTRQMHGEVRDALRQVANDDTCRALLLTANGRGFCAGQDLSDRVRKAGEGPPDLSASLETYYNPLIRKLRAMSKPVVCAVNGVAAGAGANLALAGDIVLAARSAKFVQTFSKVGLIPDSGGTWVLPRSVGTARASALTLLAEPLPAEQAARWGMIWQVVDDDRLRPAAMDMCRRLAQLPAEGIGRLKQRIM